MNMHMYIYIYMYIESDLYWVCASGKISHLYNVTTAPWAPDEALLLKLFPSAAKVCDPHAVTSSKFHWTTGNAGKTASPAGSVWHNQSRTGTSPHFTSENGSDSQRFALDFKVVGYIWVNYNNSLTRNKAILGMFPPTNYDYSEVAVRSS